MEKLLITRTHENSKQTIGQMLVFEGEKVLFGCNTLELPYLDNQRNISCIPVGVYRCRKRVSPKFGLCFIVEDVPGRSYILIHRGNFYSDIRGCILVGKGFKDVNKDGIIDVVYSTATVKNLLKILPDSFELEIK